MGACMSGEAGCCKKDQEEKAKEDKVEGKKQEACHEQSNQAEQEHVRAQEQQISVYKVVYDHVEYDVANLMEKYARTTREIQECICAIFGVMLTYVKTHKVFDATFDFCGWMPRAQHAKLDTYKSLLNNLDGLAASFGSSTLELKALKMVAYSFHESYFEGLSKAFKEDLTCIRVWCAGLDLHFGCGFDQTKLDCILENNTKWFLASARVY